VRRGFSNCYVRARALYFCLPESPIYSITIPGVNMGSAFDGCEIYDIRQDTKSTSLKQEIIQGLSADPPSLPSLLLWDDRGQELFDSFSQTPSYHPFHSELEIINKRAADIARSVPDKSALIELGCG
jgi:hypothetical protein